MASTAQNPSLTDARRALLARRIRLFVAATISYNAIEAVVAIGEGARVSSTALVGFGLDSVIEVSSAAAVAWQFAGRDPEAREKIALRIIAFSFFGLATYVTVDAVRALVGAGEAEHSTLGILLAALSLAVMPVLSYAQRRAGRELGSLSAVADSKQTLLCTYLSAVLLVGLALNSLFGWSWADPIAGLVIAAIAVREGINAWRVRPAARHRQPSRQSRPGPAAAAATTRPPARWCESSAHARARSASTDSVGHHVQRKRLRSRTLSTYMGGDRLRVGIRPMPTIGIPNSPRRVRLSCNAERDAVPRRTRTTTGRTPWTKDQDGFPENPR